MILATAIAVAVGKQVRSYKQRLSVFAKRVYQGNIRQTMAKPHAMIAQLDSIKIYRTNMSAENALELYQEGHLSALLLYWRKLHPNQ
jgi:hypothetical protein